MQIESNPDFSPRSTISVVLAGQGLREGCSLDLGNTDHMQLCV